ncbi:MAG TPA: nucleoside triphosphate pyrophosphohydrolase family protein [Candidatus Merdenecus merdavium]|nr:nucleoside triphosphate pyrophosphohydrolase family protein [Candidatus Merdenecus merdavium]
MKINEYQKLAMRTASKESKEDLLLNGALGLSGETEEVADYIKKYLFQGHSLKEEDLIEELGDICWYIAIMAEGLGVDLESVMEGNIDKLRTRYPQGFDRERSINHNIGDGSNFPKV